MNIREYTFVFTYLRPYLGGILLNNLGCGKDVGESWVP